MADDVERLLAEQVDYYRARAGEYVDSTLTRGRVVLGVFQVASGATPPFEVLFKSVEILTPAGA